MNKCSIAYRLALIVLLSWIATSTRAQPQNGQLRVAVAPFESPTDNPYWWHGGGEAIQNAFVSQLRKSDRFRATSTKHSNLKRIRNLLGADYMLAGTVTEYGKADAGLAASVEASIIDAETGEILWRDEASHVLEAGNQLAKGNRRKIFHKVMKPIVMDLTASIKAADL